MNSVQLGSQAESIVAHYLIRCGYSILDTNWKTRTCEIDIIALQGTTISFVEVKYRSTHSCGDGLEYITHKKLRQMQYAAKLWIAKHRWYGQYQLSAAAVHGNEVAFLESIY